MGSVSREHRLTLLRMAVDMTRGQQTAEVVVKIAQSLETYVAEAPETDTPKLRASKQKTDTV